MCYASGKGETHMKTLHFFCAAVAFISSFPGVGCSGAPKEVPANNEPRGEASPNEAAAEKAQEEAVETADPQSSAPVDARTEISGCLARQSEGLSRSAGATGDIDELPSSLPKKPPLDDAKDTTPELTLTVDRDGVRMHHAWRHACCLTATVAAHTTGRRLDIVQTISGTPCRCMCQSVINTAVPLSAGDWEVVVQQQFDYGTLEVHREKVTVP
jgi:hypothetical protein